MYLIMSRLVQSLRRLYLAGNEKVTEERLLEMVAKGTISEAEFEWIIAE